GLPGRDQPDAGGGGADISVVMRLPLRRVVVRRLAAPGRLEMAGEAVGEGGEEAQLAGDVLVERLLAEAPSPVAAEAARRVHAGVASKAQHILKRDHGYIGDGEHRG